MKNETLEDFETIAPFTMAALETFKKNGFQYVQVKGFSTEKKLDYMEPRYLVLIPMKNLPVNPGEIEIYEPIDSQLLLDWATHPRDGIQVLISFNKK